MKIKRSLEKQRTGRKKSTARKASKITQFSELDLQMPKKKAEWKIQDFDGLAEGMKVAERIGLPTPKSPTVEEIDWPGDALPDVSYKVLSQLLGQLGELSAYASWLLFVSEAEREAWEAKYVYALEQRVLKHENAGYQQRNHELREALADGEQDVKYRLKRFLRASALVKIIGGLVATYDNYYTKLSRELTMREAGWRKTR